jgi:hypothetical protein
MSLHCSRCHKEVTEPMGQHLPKCPGPDKEKAIDKTIFLSPVEVNTVRMTLGLLNSMVLSGEQHSNLSHGEGVE